jgi:glycosyltransferase 2 family protein
MPNIRLANIALASLLVGFFAIGLIIHHVGYHEILRSVVRAHLLYLALFLLTSIILALMLTLKWQIVLDAKSARVPYWRLFSYRLVGYSVSYLTPTAHVGGEPIRAYLLKREGIDINTAFSTVIIDKSVELFINVVIFCAGALLILNSVDVTRSMKLIILSLSLLMLFVAGLFIGGVLGKQSMFVAIFRFLRLHKIKRLVPLEKNLVQIEKEVEIFYRRNTGHFLAIVCLMLLIWVLMFLEYRFALMMFGYTPTAMEIFFILTGVGIAYSIPIPAAMGILELGQLSAAKVLDLSSATGIALAFIIRARDLLWTILGLAFLSIYQFNFWKLSRQTQRIDREFEQGDLFRRRA